MPVNPEPYNPGYPVNFTPEGDATKDAILKHMQEIIRIYGLLYGIDINQLKAEDLEEFSDTYFPNGVLDINKIKDGSITGGKLAKDSVTSEKIKDGSIRTEDLADEAVTGDKIKDGSINRDKLEGGMVGDAHFAEAAGKLQSARTIITNLQTTNAASFDGTANIEPGVKGILPKKFGGTGNANGEVTATAVAGVSREFSLPGDPDTEWVYLGYQPGRSGGGESADQYSSDVIAGKGNGGDAIYPSPGGPQGVLYYIAVRVK